MIHKRLKRVEVKKFFAHAQAKVTLALSTITSYNPSNLFARAQLGWSEKNCARCVKDLKDNKHDSLRLGQKYARIFVLGHNLFLEAHSFP